MRLTDAMILGAGDYVNRSPGARVPDGDVLAPLVCAYWDGWTAAVMDGAAETVRRRRATGAGAIIGANTNARRGAANAHGPTGQETSSA